MFMPRTPVLHATPKDAAAAEADLDITALVQQGVETASAERFRLVAGKVEDVEDSTGVESSAERNARAASACAIEVTRD